MEGSIPPQARDVQEWIWQDIEMKTRQAAEELLNALMEAERDTFLV